jgi:hypothetical protein
VYLTGLRAGGESQGASAFPWLARTNSLSCSRKAYRRASVYPPPARPRPLRGSPRPPPLRPSPSRMPPQQTAAFSLALARLAASAFSLQRLQPPALASPASSPGLQPGRQRPPWGFGLFRYPDHGSAAAAARAGSSSPAPSTPAAGCWRIHIRSPQLLLRTPNATGRGSPLEGAWLFSKTAHFASDSPDIQLGPGPVSPTAHCMPLPLATTTVQMTKRPSSSSCLKQLLRMRIPQMLQMCSLITGERLRGGWRECCRWCDGTVRTKESDSWERLCASPPTAPQCWVLAVPVAVCWGGGGREHCRRCCRGHHDITKEGR